MLQTRTRAAAITDAYAATRSFTETLAAPLSPEDQVVQSMPDVSPTKWHRAHTTWFFETFVLREFVPDHAEYDPAYGYLFNSYYESVGARYPRPQRGLLSRPSVGEVTQYRDAVDGAMQVFLSALSDDDTEILDLVELGLHHEQQHQELVLMDIKHVLSVNPMQPAYLGAVTRPATDPDPLTWSGFDGGQVEIGHRSDGFCFDNELPRHRTLVPAFELGERLITCGEWLEFMADGGYRMPGLWLSEGWHHIQSEGWDAPSYWCRSDDRWEIFTLAGPRPVDPAEPVVHVSLYEADAFARWAGARLPTEAEWEHAASDRPVMGNFVESGEFHPVPAEGSGLRQLFGDVWEWTQSPYTGYPGFAAAPGAVGEYNGKFMLNQTVLRGGCCATVAAHTRASYRNFFPAHSRWMFSGLRLARDAR